MTRATWRFGLLLALACLTSVGAVAGPEAPWQRHNAAGLHALGQRRFADAEIRFTAALMEAERHGPDSARVAATLDYQARLQAAQGKFAPAEALLRRALAIREKVLAPDDPELATTLGRIGALALRQHRLVEAERLVRSAVASLGRALPADDPRLAAALNTLGMLALMRGERFLALAFTVVPQGKADGQRLLYFRGFWGYT